MKREVFKIIISQFLLALSMVTVLPKEWIHNCEHHQEQKHQTQHSDETVIDGSHCVICEYSFAYYTFTPALQLEEICIKKSFFLTPSTNSLPHVSLTFFSLRAPPYLG